MGTKQTDKGTGESASEGLAWARPGDERMSLTDLLRAGLDRPAEGEGVTWKHRLIDGLLRRAAEGDLKAIQEIWTRLEGKPGAAHEAHRELPLFSRALSLRILRAADELDDTDGDDAEDEASDDYPDHPARVHVRRRIE